MRDEDKRQCDICSHVFLRFDNKFDGPCPACHREGTQTAYDGDLDVRAVIIKLIEENNRLSAMNKVLIEMVKEGLK